MAVLEGQREAEGIGSSSLGF